MQNALKKVTWPRQRRNRRGFSIIELLVAIIIIGILVAVLIPVVSNRTEQARQARVQADLEGLAASMSRAAIDTGYYVRLFALNDVLRGDGIGFNRNLNNDEADGLTDYDASVTNPWYQFATDNSLFIEPATGVFADLDRSNLIARMVRSETRYDGGLSWGGPYINWQRDENLINNLLAPDGLPDDPWGNNYLFFTRAGMILEPDGLIIQSTNVDNTGELTQTGPYDTDIFDRATLVSMGPNGVPGNGLPASDDGKFGRGDDFVRPFGK